MKKNQKSTKATVKRNRPTYAELRRTLDEERRAHDLNAHARKMERLELVERIETLSIKLDGAHDAYRQVVAELARARRIMRG